MPRPQRSNKWYHHDAANDLIKLLTCIHQREGRWYMDVFRDFLVVAEHWVPLKARYKPQSFRDFAEAFGCLLEASAYPDGMPIYADVLGNAYMQFVPSRGQNSRGQYFTPWTVAQFMARLTCGDIEQEARQRLKAAIEQSPIAQTAMLAIKACPDTDAALRAPVTRNDSGSVHRVGHYAARRGSDDAALPG